MNFSTLLFGLSFVMVTSGATATTPKVPVECGDYAASAVEKKFDEHYDREGFQSYQCELSPRGRAVVCEVAASKGEGAAMDTYRVILSRSCKTAFRIDLLTEE